MHTAHTLIAKICCLKVIDTFRFSDPGGIAIIFDHSQIGGDILLGKDTKIVGDVFLFATTIDGALICDSRPVGKLDLQGANVGTLIDDPATWPEKGNLLLDGFTYGKIGDGAWQNVDSRKAWLALQADDRFRPQPYEQLAAVLRASGQNNAATEILIEKERQHAQLSDLSTSQWIWYRLFGPLIDYGHRPWKALWLALLLIILGSFVFGIGAIGNAAEQIMMPTDKNAYCDDSTLHATYPRLNVLVYSFDAFVPLTDLDQAKKWLPSADRGRVLFHIGRFNLRTGGIIRGYLWFHAIAGWTLTTLFAIGLAGLVQG